MLGGVSKLEFVSGTAGRGRVRGCADHALQRGRNLGASRETRDRCAEACFGSPDIRDELSPDRERVTGERDGVSPRPRAGHGRTRRSAADRVRTSSRREQPPSCSGRRRRHRKGAHSSGRRVAGLAEFDDRCDASPRQKSIRCAPVVAMSPMPYRSRASRRRRGSSVSDLRPNGNPPDACASPIGSDKDRKRTRRPST
jgi:hypothetical protein